MKYLILILNILISSGAFSQNGDFRIALCKKGAGCQEIITKLSEPEVFKQLKRPGLLELTKRNQILIVEDCIFKNEFEKSLDQLHFQYGGKGPVSKLPAFNFEKYLAQNKCLACPNPTKKISMSITADEMSGTGYFFISWEKEEAFMPNAAYQQLYKNVEGASSMTIDAFFKDYNYITYAIDSEGGKWKMNMPIGTSVMSFGKDKENEARFKRDFKATGKKRPFLGGSDFEVEYLGKDDEGKPITFWLGPAKDVCLPLGKFDALGFYNLGYIAVDGITYAVTEISGSGFKAKVTGIENGSYSFNPVGYKSIGY